MCPLYVVGRIGPGERKSVGPMAQRVAPGHYDRLHHFVSDGLWDEAPLERELAIQADNLVGGADAFLVIDDTALPKKGTHSVEGLRTGKLSEEARFDGVSLLRTKAKLTPLQAVLRCRDLLQVETLFLRTKAIMCTRPIFRFSDAAICGHVFCLFLALSTQKHFDDPSRQAGLIPEWRLSSRAALVPVAYRLSGRLVRRAAACMRQTAMLRNW